MTAARFREINARTPWSDYQTIIHLTHIHCHQDVDELIGRTFPMYVKATGGTKRMVMPTDLLQLQRQIVRCRKCERLVKFREQISREKRKMFADFDYWGKPVPGFGDPKARLMVVGLAPAAHGGNRTGRVFTGDSSAKFLVKHLFEAGFANQATSETRDDGLKYLDCYVTAVVRCVPPGDKPTKEEIDNCTPFFEREIELLEESNAILALGSVAFNSIIRYAKNVHGVKGQFIFRHGGKYHLSQDLPTLFASYHPSPRNTNTGKLTSVMFSDVLREIRKYLDEESL